MSTERASFTGRQAPLLFGLLFVTAILAAVVLWVPIAVCPVCGGDGLLDGPGLARRQCRECAPGGKVSVLRKWTLLHQNPAGPPP